jgi:hypothetical protein
MSSEDQGVARSVAVSTSVNSHSPDLADSFVFVCIYKPLSQSGPRSCRQDGRMSVQLHLWEVSAFRGTITRLRIVVAAARARHRTGRAR